MNNDDYKEALFYAASIFNERMGTEFSEDNLVLCCFQTKNQQGVFEQICKQYFPDRLEDRYTEDGYFDFHASAFIGKEDGVDGILLRTDIARHPAVLKHILLHELAHAEECVLTSMSNTVWTIPSAAKRTEPLTPVMRSGGN